MTHIRNNTVLIGIFIFIGCLFLTLVHTVGAQESIDDLRKKIEEGQQQLEQIEEEIEKYESQLNKVGAEKETLKNAIRKLDLSREKVKASIRATEKKISSTDLEIEELEREIYVKELEINKNKDAIARSFQKVDQTENDTVLEILLGHDSMAEVWDELEEQALLQESLRESTSILHALKTEYEKAKNKSLEKKGELVELTNELSGEENALASTIYQKDELLDETENKEANYQKLLAEKKAAKKRFEKALREYESKLKFILDPDSIPAVGSGVLRWPLEPSYMSDCATEGSYNKVPNNDYCLTQYFGNTAFAQSGAYNGQGHNGIDFRAQIGTRINAALDGVVQAVNHKTAQNCQYGKWVLIRHDNGLTTLYAHLSSISVDNGQTVSTGQLIGHSGNTGYSTGPHLHFTVYASKAVQFKEYTCNSGPTVSVPVSAYSGYLNPLNYL